MAGRKAEPGLSYYRMNCGHTMNKKVRLLFNEFSSDGYWIWQCIIDHAYSHKGYYFDCNDKDELELFATDVCKRRVSVVEEVISGCIRRGLFDKTVFDMFGVLSSVMMQETYLDATKERRRKGTVIELFQELLLIEIDLSVPSNENISIVPRNKSILPRKNEEIPGSNATKESKGEKSKEKKSKGVAPEAPDDPLVKYEFILKVFNEKFIPQWEKWKDYKLKEFKFKFKSEQSEQSSFTELVNLSSSNQQKACAIIEQSLANGWKGFFELKNENLQKVNTSSTQKTELSKIDRDFIFLYESYQEGRVYINTLSDEHFYYMRKHGVKFSPDSVQAIEKSARQYIDDEKLGKLSEDGFKVLQRRFAVIEFFKQQKEQGHAKVFWLE